MTGCCCYVLLRKAIVSQPMDKMIDDSNIWLERASTKGHHSYSFMLHILPIQEPFSGCVPRKISTDKLLLLLTFAELFFLGQL